MGNLVSLRTRSKISNLFEKRTRCYVCKNWYRKRRTFLDGVYNRRYCVDCVPSDIFQQMVYTNDEIPLL